MSTTRIRGNTQIMAGTIGNTEIASDAAIALSKLSKTVVAADGTNAFSADQSLGGHKLTNVADPVGAQDAATKAYVDSLAQGLDVRQSVRGATTANITLSGTQTIDTNVALQVGDRVLVKDQETSSQNGIYVVASGAWTRAADADSNADVTAGMFVFVEEGAANADTGWVLTTNNPIDLGTTGLTFAQFSGAGTILGGAGLSKTGSTLDVGAGDGIQVNTDTIEVKLNGTTLSKSSSGLKLADLAEGKILIGSAGSVATAQSLSGDVSLAASGAATVVAASDTVAGKIELATTAEVTTGTDTGRAITPATLKAEIDRRLIVRETPTGTVNSSNVTFTLAATPISGTEQVFLNGILQEPGSGNDYQISGSTITYETAPASGDRLRVTYLKA